MDNSSIFAALFRKYLDNRCSAEEVDQLMAFLKEDAYKQYAEGLIEGQVAAQMDDLRPVDRAIRERLELRLQAIFEGEDASAIPIQQQHFLRRNRWWAAAAAIILLCGTGTYLWLTRSPKPVLVQVKPKSPVPDQKQDVMPGGNKAMLTLGNGATVILDTAANGQITNQGQTAVTKLNAGQIVYGAANSPSTGEPVPTGREGRGEVMYNTLTTPRGGQYQLVLPDGSTVWLNAASSIRFPTAFVGNERRVEVTGEAYFEIAKNAAMPFRVQMNNGAAVEVVGTHFNINAYDDEEAIKTTLLEGSVKVTKGNVSAILKPGEQASLSHKPQSSKKIPVGIVDVEEVMAWKNGAFQFGGGDIQSVMRQISRWYDVEVEYKGNISLHFGGSMSRNVNISQVLDMLERAGGIKTSVTGKKITVMP